LKFEKQRRKEGTAGQQQWNPLHNANRQLLKQKTAYGKDQRQRGDQRKKERERKGLLEREDDR